MEISVHWAGSGAEVSESTTWKSQCSLSDWNIRSSAGAGAKGTARSAMVTISAQPEPPLGIRRTGKRARLTGNGVCTYIHLCQWDPFPSLQVGLEQTLGLHLPLFRCTKRAAPQQAEDRQCQQQHFTLFDFSVIEPHAITSNDRANSTELTDQISAIGGHRLPIIGQL